MHSFPLRTAGVSIPSNASAIQYPQQLVSSMNSLVHRKHESKGGALGGGSGACGLGKVTF